ncbi:MAG: phenylalanine--tRNA ligase subunit beta [Patescibacteria group bacterium]
MYLSLNWLKDYIDLPKKVTPQKLAEDLTMSTVEVESVKDQSEDFKNIIIGKIAVLKSHPNADKLKIAMTDIGQKESAQIVCGGVNLQENMLVAVALPGARVRWHGEGEPVILEQTKIRGEKSFGMICSSNEIGIDNMFPCGEMEITDLSDILSDKDLGKNLSEVLGLNDIIIEIENKSLTNRPDLWSHYGIARELASIYNLELKQPEIFKLDNKNFKNPENSGLNINIKNNNLCSRYIGCLVKNIKIQKSPDWIIKRLEAVGLRGINNIVDITNYVLADIGEPTHAFDRHKLTVNIQEKTKINIRQAEKGENIKSLDGEERKLDENNLVIADNEKAVAIAGIIGGANSEVDENTTEVILEAATFSAMSVRKTSQKLNLRTEASIRFEKNLDSNSAELAMLRMLFLIKEIIPEAKITEYIDEYPVKQEQVNIKVRHDFIEKKIGQKFNIEEILKILSRLGFSVKENSGEYIIEVPSWRATDDISIPEDIVEEVARIYGYDNLLEKAEKVELGKAKFQPTFDLENKVKNYLSLGCGMNEVFNYPWYDSKIIKKYNIKNNPELLGIEIANPPAEENKFLQVSLIPNLIKNTQDNLRYFSEFKLFELARVFKHGIDKSFGKDVLPEQPKMLAGVVVGKDVFFELKGIIEKFLVFNFKFQNKSKFNNFNFLNSKKSLDIYLKDKQVGYFGVLENKIKNKEVGVFELNFDELCGHVALQRSAQKFEKLPQFPAIERDIAVEVGWDIKWCDLKNVIIGQANDSIIKEVNFLSEYDLGDKKSLAFRVIYQTDRTLEDKEVEVIENKIIRLLKNKFNAELRK